MEYFLKTQPQNSSAKISLVVQSNSLEYFQQHKSLNWHQLKNINFHVNQISFYFFINNFFLNIVDEAIQRLTSTGIMNFQISLMFTSRQVNEHKKCKVLTLENLSFGFVIWLCSLVVTVVAFAMEIVLFVAIKEVKRRFSRYVRNKWSKYAVVYPVKVQKQNK
jgi:hypothetical protein